MFNVRRAQRPSAQEQLLAAGVSPSLAASAAAASILTRMFCFFMIQVSLVVPSVCADFGFLSE